MKRILLIALVTLISFNGAIAQSMSDSQIISFIQKEQKKCLSDMESQYRKYGDKWVSALVKRVISS